MSHYNNSAMTLADLKRGVMKQAHNNLTRMLADEDRAKAAAVRCGLAFEAAVASAKRPEALLSCSMESIARCVAMTAITDLSPGGPASECWLVPKGGHLQWWIGHRGIMKAGRRSGYQIRPVIVAKDDPVLRVEFGDVVEHESNIDGEPMRWEDIRGGYVTITHMATGRVIGRPWLNAFEIGKRREKALNQAFWNAWPVEMSMKTLLHWVLKRGLIDIGEDLNHAFAMEAQQQPQAPAITDRRAAQAAALGIEIEQPALPDYGEPQTMAIEAREGARVGEE